jgi:hypothetical protein
MKRLVFAALLLLVLPALASAGSLSTDNGKYAFGQISDSRQDQYLLNTETGQLWRLLEEDAVSAQVVLVPVRYVTDADLMEISRSKAIIKQQKDNDAKESAEKRIKDAIERKKKETTKE